MNGVPARATTIARTGLVRAALITVGVTLAGSALGLVRDLVVARLFGATDGTDAFLVAWMVPETAFPLVVEGALAFVLVPLFSRAVSGERDVRDVVAATAPRLVGVLAAASAAVALGAPLMVRLVAPGLADPALAVTCTRYTALTVLTFGVAGYLSAALRAHHVFGAPAAIHLGYNLGILGTIWWLHSRLGIVSAAAGVALGGVLMVAVQLPAFVRHVGLPRRLTGGGVAPLTLAAFAPVGIYTVTRQAQVFVERFLGSHLAPGTISHLNYAQKVAQLPMLVALLVCTVTFPTLARTVAAGETERARHRLAADLRTVMALILVAAAYLVVFAPAVVEVLLQHGRFGAADTAATAAIMRVYALGLLGHALVGVLCRPYFTGARPARSPRSRRRAPTSWYPALAMGVGLAVNAVVAAVTVSRFGGPAIAAANGAGITVTAVLLLAGLRGARGTVSVSVRATGAGALRLAAAAAGAGAAGWLAGRVLAGCPSIVVAAAGGVVVLGAYAGLARLAGDADLVRRVRRAN